MTEAIKPPYKVVQRFYTLHSRHSSLVLDCRGNAPAILYWGAAPRGWARRPEMFALLAHSAGGSRLPMPEEAPIALSPELGAGFQGNAGIQVHRQGRAMGELAPN